MQYFWHFIWHLWEKTPQIWAFDWQSNAHILAFVAGVSVCICIRTCFQQWPREFSCARPLACVACTRFLCNALRTACAWNFELCMMRTLMHTFERMRALERMATQHGQPNTGKKAKRLTIVWRFFVQTILRLRNNKSDPINNVFLHIVIVCSLQTFSFSFQEIWAALTLQRYRGGDPWRPFRYFRTFKKSGGGPKCVFWLKMA